MTVDDENDSKRREKKDKTVQYLKKEVNEGTKCQADKKEVKKKRTRISNSYHLN